MSKPERYWEQKNFCGRKKNFKTAAELWKAAVEYFNWVEDNPLKEQKAFAYKGEVTLVDVEKPRPMTLQRMCSFIGLDYSNYSRRYRKDEKYELVCAKIDAIIRENKFEGAAAGLFNPVIIARDLGLVDRVDQTTNGESTNTATVVVTKEDVQDVLDMI